MTDPYDPDVDEEELTDGPPDPQLDPERSPGFDGGPTGLDDVEVSREDVTIGEADPEDLSAADTAPVAGESPAALLEQLQSGAAKERQRAALALGETDGPEPVRTGLANAALEDDDADVRQFAVESLGEVGGADRREGPPNKGAGSEGSQSDPETVEGGGTTRETDATRDLGGDDIATVAKALATDDEDPWVRAEAVVALDHLDRAAHADVLEAALDDDHHAVRRNAAISLFKLRGEATRDLLLAQTEDESERVREWAAHLLGGVTGEQVEERLRELAETDASRVVQQTAAHALAADPGSFRRQFTGALDRGDTTLPGEDHLNRQPDL